MFSEQRLNGFNISLGKFYKLSLIVINVEFALVYLDFNSVSLTRENAVTLLGSHSDESEKIVLDRANARRRTSTSHVTRLRTI